MPTPPHAPRARAALLALLALAACATPPAPRPPRAPLAFAAPAEPYADVASYTMRATLAASHRVIDGEATVAWTNRSSAPATELWWHLYMNAFEGPDTLFMRTGGREGHRGHAPGERGSIDVTALSLASGEDLLAGATYDPDVPRDRTQLRTRLPRPIAPGATVEIHARFRTTLPHAFARAGYDRDFAFAGQWFPKLAVLERDGRWAHFPYHYQSEFYADFGRYDVTLDVPRGDVVGACGTPQGPTVVSGDRVRVRYVAERVHDFAWTAWSHFRETDARAGSIALRVLYPPGEDRVAERAIASLQGAIPHFARRYGPYPYPTLTVVVPPRGAAGVGGMEYPTLITTEGFWFGPDGVRDVEWVTIHEFAHQYFYGLVATDEWSWPFLDEGLAEYSTGVAMTELYGLDREMGDVAGLHVGYWAMEGAASGAIRRGLPIARAAARFPSYMSYGLHVYRRTATVLRTAERTWGDDGVARALALYASRGRFGHPGPEALVEAFRATLGNDVADGYLTPALFDDASFDDAIERIGAAGFRATHQGSPAVPMDVAVTDAAGRTRRERWTGDAPRAFEPTGREPIASVRIDADARVPLDRDTLDNARATAGHAGGHAALTSSVAWWIAAALRAVGP